MKAILLLIPLESQARCLSDMLAYGLMRSSIVTAARALMLEDTVLGIEITNIRHFKKTSAENLNLMH